MVGEEDLVVGMTWILLSAVAVLVIGVALMVVILTSVPDAGTDSYAHQSANERKGIAALVAIITGLLWIIMTVLMSVETVDVGKVGVVKSFGHITGELDSGWHGVPPWADVITFETRVKTMRFAGDENTQPAIAAFSSETQNVQVKATLNYNVDPADVGQLYRQVGSNFEILIPSRVNQVVKDETVKYTATSLAPNREKLRQSVVARLKTELAPFSINVLDVNLDNISFSTQFEKAIEAKQEATQEALKAQQQVQSATFQAQSRVEAAKGDAEVLRQKANGQADANRSLNASLSPAVLQYLTIQKLAGNISVIMLPTGDNQILDLSKLLPAKAATP